MVELPGFIGDDIFLVRGDGVSSPNMKTPIQAEATAKEAAKMDARRFAMEFCAPWASGIPGCCSMAVQDPYTLPSRNKELQQELKGLKAHKIKCQPEGTGSLVVECKVIFVLKKQGIRQLCERSQKGNR